jgi:hypothetical protein
MQPRLCVCPAVKENERRKEDKEKDKKAKMKGN